MHPDDLRTIWECHDCGRKFFYHSDIASHVRELGHSKVISKDYARKKRDAVFVRRHASLSFKIGGQKAKLDVECKYYPSTECIAYTNVNYSDKRLEHMIEHNPGMMRKVDQYLRQLFRSESSKAATS
jgi:hypothetical protein